ncbi:DUF1223 domain-containing protein [Mucilaginibacter ginkgonis]|uniref:DUF1223 domain-containing protein n=1 Tax=Mucilaginibacter ginkgonis TaxID=2682091 RepID=A0A6I4ING5_9SPHI|nr:DUF1223 domain-containing protein [Mucilaginibacter ginkgonis]QQL49804.1 DUF1223 domain-containing protein [Mucilaginibacter ginkgonis]
MTRTKLTTVIALVIVVITATAFTTNGIFKKNHARQGFAVVELFTSEGCSSCPPADALIARIQNEMAGKPVYILAYHVDYWNRLGWRDVFSDAACTAKQKQYVNWIKGSSVYTPQIVVNGRKEFIGSEEGTLRNSIKAAEQSEANSTLSLNDLTLTGNHINFNYKTSGNESNTSLVVAVVQKSATTKVEAGENSGRTLAHVQIVRQLQTLTLKKPSGNGNIELSKGLNTKNLEVIAFLQNQTNGQISAACKTSLQNISL